MQLLFFHLYKRSLMMTENITGSMTQAYCCLLKCYLWVALWLRSDQAAQAAAADSTPSQPSVEEDLFTVMAKAKGAV